MTFMNRMLFIYFFCGACSLCSEVHSSPEFSQLQITYRDIRKYQWFQEGHPIWFHSRRTLLQICSDFNHLLLWGWSDSSVCVYSILYSSSNTWCHFISEFHFCHYYQNHRFADSRFWYFILTCFQFGKMCSCHVCVSCDFLWSNTILSIEKFSESLRIKSFNKRPLFCMAVLDYCPVLSNWEFQMLRSWLALLCPPK